LVDDREQRRSVDGRRLPAQLLETCLERLEVSGAVKALQLESLDGAGRLPQSPSDLLDLVRKSVKLIAKCSITDRTRWLNIAS
jgi:hypothetical protein